MDVWPSNGQKVKLYDQVTAQDKYKKNLKLIRGKNPAHMICFLWYLQNPGDIKIDCLSWNKARYHKRELKEAVGTLQLFAERFKRRARESGTLLSAVN